MILTFNHQNYRCPKCGSRDLELHDTGTAPIPANDEALSFDLTSKTSVLLRILEHVFGSYATAVSPSLLMEHRNEPHPERIAKLKGVRLVTTSELSTRKRFDNEETKRLTGGDTLVGRFISANSFSFLAYSNVTDGCRTKYHSGMLSQSAGEVQKLKLK